MLSFLHTKQEKFILILIVILIVLIPITSFVLSKRANVGNIKSKAYEEPVTQTASSSAKEVPKSEAVVEEDSSISSNKPLVGVIDNTSPNAQLSLGPTLNFRLRLEGRPEASQSGKFFLGIAEGQPTTNPTYRLTFMVTLPASGIYEGLSISGLTTGTTYTAYIKGQTQIATASSFLAQPAVTNLNQGAILNLLTGDLNEDNVITVFDYAIAKKAYGANSSMPNWNPLADFNLDGIVNNFDLAIILRNLGKTGASGPWISTPKVASSSATQSATSSATKSGGLTSQGSPSSDSVIIPDVYNGGYWQWVPGL